MSETPAPGRTTEVVVLMLCEAAAVYLRPDTLYRFEVGPTCASCRRDAALASPPWNAGGSGSPVRVTA